MKLLTNKQLLEWWDKQPNEIREKCYFRGYIGGKNPWHYICVEGEKGDAQVLRVRKDASDLFQTERMPSMFINEYRYKIILTPNDLQNGAIDNNNN